MSSSSHSRTGRSRTRGRSRPPTSRNRSATRSTNRTVNQLVSPRASSNNGYPSGSNRSGPGSNSDSETNRPVVYPRQMARIIETYYKPSGRHRSRNLVPKLSREYERWVRYLQYDPGNEGFFTEMHVVIVNLLRRWSDLKPLVLRSAAALGTPETILRSNLTMVKKVYDYTRGETNHTRRAHETLHLIPFLRIVMPRLSFVRRFGRLYEQHPAETFRELVSAHRETRRHLRDVENFRARPNVPLEDSRFGRRVMRPVVSNDDENDPRSRGPRAARPPTHAPWIDDIAEITIPNTVHPNNKIDLLTLEPITRGVRLRCGHWVAKSTLQGMVRSRRRMECPFCRASIRASDFPSRS